MSPWFTWRPRATCSATFSMLAAGKAFRPSSFLFSIRSLRDCSPPYSMARHLDPSLAVVKARNPWCWDKDAELSNQNITQHYKEIDCDWMENKLLTQLLFCSMYLKCLNVFLWNVLIICLCIFTVLENITVCLIATVRLPSCLTNNVWMIDSLQDLRLRIQALLVNRHLFGCTLSVDLLDSPGRRVQLSHSRINLINNIYILFIHRHENLPVQ